MTQNNNKELLLNKLSIKDLDAIYNVYGLSINVSKGTLVRGL